MEKTERVLFTIDKDIMSDFRKYTDLNQISRSARITKLIEEELRKAKKEKN